MLTPVPGIDDDAAQVRAGASDLLLWLYRRETAVPLEVIGDFDLPPVLQAYASAE